MPGDGEGMDLSVPLLPLELKRLGYKTHMLGSELVLVLRPLLVYFAGASILLSIITTSPKRHLCMTMTTICISLATISNDPVNQPATHTHTHTRALLFSCALTHAQWKDILFSCVLNHSHSHSRATEWHLGFRLPRFSCALTRTQWKTILFSCVLTHSHSHSRATEWHLGFRTVANIPVSRGFDSFFGLLAGGADHYTKTLEACGGSGENCRFARAHVCVCVCV